MLPDILWNRIFADMEWLSLRHVKESIDYGGTGLLHGFICTVPYGNVQHGTLQD